MKTTQEILKKNKKTINDLLTGLSVFALVFNTAYASAQSGWDDDVYSTPKDRAYKKTDVPTKEGNQYKGDTLINNYKTDPNYTQSDNSGGASVTNNYYSNDFNYDDYYDYGYAARLRRFYRPCYGYNYYDGYYTNSYWYDYDPYHFGTSIYLGYNWWGPTNYYYRYSSGYNWNWGYGYYGSSCSGWGGNYGYSNYSPYYGGYYGHSHNHGYNHGYANGYNHGYSDGYYDGSNNYANNNNYYNSYDNNSHYYGRRNSAESNGTNPSHQRTGSRNEAGGLAKKYEEAVATENSRNRMEVEKYSPVNEPRGRNNMVNDPAIGSIKREDNRVAPDRAPVLNNGTMRETKPTRASNYSETPGNVERANPDAGTVAPRNERNARPNTGGTLEQYNNENRSIPSPSMQSPNGANTEYNRMGNDNRREPQYNQAQPARPNSEINNAPAPPSNNNERGGRRNERIRESIPVQNQPAPRQAPRATPSPRASGNGNYQSAPRSNAGNFNRGGGSFQSASRSSGGGSSFSSGGGGSSRGGGSVRSRR